MAKNQLYSNETTVFCEFILVVKKCHNLTFKVIFLYQKLFKSFSMNNTNLGTHFLLKLFFDNFNFWTTLLLKSCPHSDSDCWILFGNWFWHLIVGNRSIGLNFYQQRSVFALKICQRPQRSIRPMKAKKPVKGQNFKNHYFINIQSKIINKWECNTRKNLFFKNWKFSFS